ncbi:MAG: hypothetical protein EB060_02245 [Proteobacteria bacterium]|nr:hypothetical protein [Pseudomonadota bacterium]
MAKAAGKARFPTFWWILVALIVVTYLPYWIITTANQRADTDAVYKTAAEIKSGYVTYGKEVFELKDGSGTKVEQETSSRLTFRVSADTFITFYNDRGKGYQVNAKIGVTEDGHHSTPKDVKWTKTDPRKK